MFLLLVLKEFTVTASNKGEPYLLSSYGQTITVDLPSDIDNGK